MRRLGLLLLAMALVVGCKGRSSSGTTGPSPLPSDGPPPPVTRVETLGYGTVRQWRGNGPMIAKALTDAGLGRTIIELLQDASFGDTDDLPRVDLVANFLRAMRAAGIKTHIHVWNNNCFPCLSPQDLVRRVEEIEQAIGGWGRDITLEVAEVQSEFGRDLRGTLRARWPSSYVEDTHLCLATLERIINEGVFHQQWFTTDCSETLASRLPDDLLRRIARYARQTGTVMLLYDFPFTPRVLAVLAEAVR